MKLRWWDVDALSLGRILPKEATCAMKDLRDFAALREAVACHITQMSEEGRFQEHP